MQGEGDVVGLVVDERRVERCYAVGVRSVAARGRESLAFHFISFHFHRI